MLVNYQGHKIHPVCNKSQHHFRHRSGTIIMGYGLIKVQGNHITLLEMGVFTTGKVKMVIKTATDL